MTTALPWAAMPTRRARSTLMPQSFAVTQRGWEKPERTARGLRAALDRLFDREHAVVQPVYPSL